MKNAYEFLDEAFQSFTNLKEGKEELKGIVEKFYDTGNVRHSYASISDWMNSNWHKLSDDFEYFVLALSAIAEEYGGSWQTSKLEKLVDYLVLEYKRFSYYQALESAYIKSPDLNELRTKIDDVSFQLERARKTLDDAALVIKEKDNLIKELDDKTKIYEKTLEEIGDTVKNQKETMEFLDKQIKSQRFDTIGLMTLTFSLFTLIVNNTSLLQKVPIVNWKEFFYIIGATNTVIVLSGLAIFGVSKKIITGGKPK